jgi:amyloid beta (A4) precursor protein-binding family B protein 2 (Fe65-like)
MGSPSTSESSATAAACDSEPERSLNEEDLPPGWEKHEGILSYYCFVLTFSNIYFISDDDGPYYWHIKSGTIQREPPENKESSSQSAQSFKRQVVQEAEVNFPLRSILLR